MKKIVTILSVFAVILGGCKQTKRKQTANNIICENSTVLQPDISRVIEEIKPFANYIEQCNTSPVNYIMGLFEKYDVVVLGERSHRDMTQYDLIQQIISDPRFIAKVGNVFTEVGVYNMADELNAVLKGTYSNDAAFDTELVKVIFNMDFMPLWEKTNYTKLMKDAYLVNKNLPAKEKISVTPTEMPFSWEQAKNMTAEEFKATVREMWKHKDLIMGNNAINELYKIFNGTDYRKKALIIYNTPHSCRYFANQELAQSPYFAYQIIADRFPKRVVNVALNWAVVSNNDNNILLSNGGKIDAAFAACGNKSIGFDLANSPFGNCVFDYATPRSTNEVKMKDVYHGFIFHKPIYEWIYSIGVPNLDKIDCKDELARRTKIFSDRKNVDKNDEFMYYSKIRTSSEIDKKHFYELIERFFKAELENEK